jgi:hypothetical protein
VTATFDPAFLEPVGRRAIVDRMLANLEGIAGVRGDRTMLGWVLRLRSSLPDAAEDVRRRLSAALRLN